MGTRAGHSASELDPLRIIGNHVIAISLLIGLFGALGAGFATYRPETYVAKASLVLEDPRGSTFSGTVRADDMERYIANQVALLRSAGLAGQASELVESMQSPRSIKTSELISNASVRLVGDTDFVEISFEAESAATAQVAANAIALAYMDAGQASLNQEVADAKASLNSAIDDVISQIDSLQSQIEASRAGDDRSTIDAQVSDIVSELARMRQPGPPPADADVRIAQLTSELEARLLIGQLDAQQGSSAVLLRRQSDALDLLGELNSNSAQFAFESDVAGDGVAQFTPAGPGNPVGISILPAVIIASFLGGLLGLGYAYWDEVRGMRFSHRLEPEVILDAPALAQIPDFREEGLRSELPVRDAPTTVSAEAFRFLMAAMNGNDSPAKRKGNTKPSHKHRSIAVVSGNVGAGKSTIVANSAMAAAEEGLRVLVVDADIGSQQVTAMLVGHADHEQDLMRSDILGDGPQYPPFIGSKGLTELVDGEPLDDVVKVVALSDGSPLSVLSYGESQVEPISFFRSEKTAATLAFLHKRFDLILVDIPPILHVAYAAAVLRLVSDVIVVVPHESESSQLRGLSDQLNLLGIHPLGYVYNRAPLGKKIERAGSLASVPSQWA